MSDRAFRAGVLRRGRVAAVLMAGAAWGVVPGELRAQESRPAPATRPSTTQSAGDEAKDAPPLSLEEQAKLRGLREKPVAAGRDKASLFVDAETERRVEHSKRVLDMVNRDCEACHECETPTKENPCLRMCPSRLSVAQAIGAEAHETLPAEVVLLDAFDWGERRFLPVPFNHRLHADMAGMAGGCQVCHHHTMKDQIHPSCKTCHKAVFARSAKEEMRMPSLKGAYHRQCMGCHRDWSHETKCSVCHLQKGELDKPVKNVKELLSNGDVAAHPPIENPEEILHKTGYEPAPYVVFRHKDHIDRYGYTCERCHKGQTCSRCHEQGEEARQPTSGPYKREQTHGACFPCHEDDRCDRCHSKDERPQPQYMDHSATGFALGKHHEQLTCRACHKRMFFTRKLQGECSFCHGDWAPGRFVHAKTGLVLDETHADVACEQCHLERKYRRPPSCGECHDESVSYPASLPGKRTTTAPAGATSG